ncbi:hypothetical protein PHYSODRAFT_332667 [Phytophthora sojae]|uniref:Uncharacterized protein n=1 Tax=Phytophthora sojae (strain P6497) TaxID=1094619 RepID=G4ZCZ6_PHYSP|nr:hypothetical protein PHYSODRAFT_332667 [Phytophthora sojae]EGZ18944.1 hypothetical protein PHYSODRAFT_332667 [Phytophthora sojae]|eukprot:XP_009528002.1 hypothetical protein PHYSODRAFT_332667 [Phytophthora sojae]
MGSSALQTGTLSKDDCYAVAMKFECSPRVVKDRFDKRGSPRKKRGRPRPNIGELADKLTEATAGDPVIEYNFADIAHTVKMKPRTYRRYHDEVMLELMLRNAPAKGTWGRTVLLLKLLMQLIDGTTDSMFISACYFSHMEIVRRIVYAYTYWRTTSKSTSLSILRWSTRRCGFWMVAS